MTSDGPPRVSVVVPAFNREQFLGRTIDSVLGQTMTDWELVVSDDGSVDGTAVIAQRYADRDAWITVVRAANGGVAHARNRGLAATDRRVEYIVFLDSDDRWYPDTLASMVSALDEHPELGSVYGLARCIDEDDRPIPDDTLTDWMRERYEYRGWDLVAIEPDAPVTFGGMMHQNYTFTPGLHLIRRGVVDQVGPYDPHTDPADDWDMAIRVSRAAPIGFLDQMVLEWRRHPATLSNTSTDHRKASYRVRAKTLGAPDNTSEQRTLARIGYLATSRTMLQQSWKHLRARQSGEATREAAKAADVAAHYAVAAASSGVRRLVAGLRGVEAGQ